MCARTHSASQLVGVRVSKLTPVVADVSMVSVHSVAHQDILFASRAESTTLA